MNKDLIKKNLSDSFDIIKDNWTVYRDAITLSIAEMLKYDGCMAMDMWLYVLRKNKALIKTDSGVKKLIPEIIEKMVEVRYDHISLTEDIYLKEIIPNMLDKPEILKCIYNEAFCAGVEDFDIMETTPTCLAYIILMANSDTVIEVMNYLYSNKRMKKVSIGKFLEMTIEALDEMLSDEDMPFHDMKPNIKDTLLRSLNYITDPVIKAECNVMLISL